MNEGTDTENGKIIDAEKLRDSVNSLATEPLTPEDEARIRLTPQFISPAGRENKRRPEKHSRGYAEGEDRAQVYVDQGIEVQNKTNNYLTALKIQDTLDEMTPSPSELSGNGHEPEDIEPTITYARENTPIVAEPITPIVETPPVQIVPEPAQTEAPLEPQPLAPQPEPQPNHDMDQIEDIDDDTRLPLSDKIRRALSRTGDFIRQTGGRIRRKPDSRFRGSLGRSENARTNRHFISRYDRWWKHEVNLDRAEKHKGDYEIAEGLLPPEPPVNQPTVSEIETKRQTIRPVSAAIKTEQPVIPYFEGNDSWSSETLPNDLATNVQNSEPSATPNHSTTTPSPEIGRRVRRQLHKVDHFGQNRFGK